MKKLAILGASYLQKPLVEKANSMHIETHCFAWENEESVCKEIADFFYPISVLEKELIYEKCKEIEIDGITTIATDICVPTISYVAEKLGLNANSYQTSIWSTNKSEMRKIFEINQVKCPKAIAIKNLSELNILSLNFPLIVKPTDRSGSRGISKVVNELELENAVEYALSESIEKKVIVEEFIDGKEISVETISWQGVHYILSITDKITTNEPYFVELEHHQPSQLPSYIQEKVKEETIKALNALQIKNGASHSEFKITLNDEIYVIEVGARMGGDFIGSHLVPLSTGYDFVKGVIEVALNKFEKPVLNSENRSGIYFLSKNTSFLLPYFEHQNDFEIQKEKKNETLKNVKNSNDRSGYLIYQSNKKINLK